MLDDDIMTEEEWRTSDEALRLMAFLRDDGKLGRRKARLLGVACARHHWHLLTDPLSRNAVETAERYAEGLADEDELEAIWQAAAGGTSTKSREESHAAVLAEFAAGLPDWLAIRNSLYMVLGQTDKRYAAVLLRDIFGPVLFRTPSINSSLLTWRGGVVRELAESAYQERQMPIGTLDPARLAVLADALEEAGCGDAEFLDHLRSRGPHVCGCWAVDLILGRSNDEVYLD